MAIVIWLTVLTTLFVVLSLVMLYNLFDVWKTTQDVVTFSRNTWDLLSQEIKDVRKGVSKIKISSPQGPVYLTLPPELGGVEDASQGQSNTPGRIRQ